MCTIEMKTIWCVEILKLRTTRCAVLDSIPTMEISNPHKISNFTIVFHISPSLVVGGGRRGGGGGYELLCFYILRHLNWPSRSSGRKSFQINNFSSALLCGTAILEIRSLFSAVQFWKLKLCAKFTSFLA